MQPKVVGFCDSLVLQRLRCVEVDHYHCSSLGLVKQLFNAFIYKQEQVLSLLTEAKIGLPVSYDFWHTSH